MIAETIIDELLRQARAVAGNAYAPYSQFSVGAAVYDASGEITCGCNVENVSYGLTICAERNALFAAVAKGQRLPVAMVLVSDGATPPSPCGACLQVMWAFNPDLPVYMGTLHDDTLICRTAREMMPYAFHDEALKKEKNSL